MKIIQISLYISIMLIIFGCSTVLEPDNVAPRLEKIITDISIPMNTSVTVTLKHIEAFDGNGDYMKVVCYTNENYTVSGAAVTPTKDFIGDLRVPVRISDGRLLSNIDTIIISIVKDVALMPLFSGAWWEYDDTIPGESVVLFSRMDVWDSVAKIFDGVEISAYEVEWSHLSQYNLLYLMSNDSTGTILHGGYTPSDTVIAPQRLYRYPSKLNDSWNYTPLKYNTTDTMFVDTDKQTTITCTNTEMYITVPAGIFECIELTFEYEMPKFTTAPSRRISSSTGIKLDLFNQVRSNQDSYSVTEKVYYSAGVGMVKAVALIDGVVQWKKVLTDYSVIEWDE